MDEGLWASSKFVRKLVAIKGQSELLLSWPRVWLHIMQILNLPNLAGGALASCNWPTSSNASACVGANVVTASGVDYSRVEKRRTLWESLVGSALVSQLILVVAYRTWQSSGAVVASQWSRRRRLDNERRWVIKQTTVQEGAREPKDVGQKSQKTHCSHSVDTK